MIEFYHYILINMIKAVANIISLKKNIINEIIKLPKLEYFIFILYI